MALTKERNTIARDGKSISAPVAAAKKILAGALVALDASGNVTPGAVSATLKKPGRAPLTVDNSTGAAGDQKSDIEFGVFLWKNSASADAITRADIGNNCYIVDDETVAKTSDTNARSVAGKVFDVETNGVWVDQR